MGAFISLSVPPSDPYAITRNCHGESSQDAKNVALDNVNSGGLPCNMGKLVNFGTKFVDL